MPFNGAGTFTLVAGNPVVTGTVISSTVHNNTNNDFAAGFTNCLTRDGQSVALANIPMGGFKLTNLANGSNPQDSVAFGQVVTLTALADTTSASNGAGMVGYDPGLSYPAGTVGEALGQAAASNSSAVRSAPTGFSWVGITPTICQAPGAAQFSEDVSQYMQRVYAAAIGIGTTWVDSVNGSDSNTGGIADPVATIEYACRTLGPSLVLVRPGVYAPWQFRSTDVQGNKIKIVRTLGPVFVRNSADDIASLSWTLSGSNVYYCSLTGANASPLAVLDCSRTDAEGQPEPLSQYSSEAAVAAAGRGWYHDDAADRLYVRYDASNVNTIKTRLRLITGDATTRVLVYGAKMLLEGDWHFEGVNLLPAQLSSTRAVLGGQFDPSTIPTVAYTQSHALDALGADTLLQGAWLHRARGDNFHYADDGGLGCQSIEINCKSTYAGDVETVPTLDGTQNGSSMHGSGYVLRVNGQYVKSYGPDIVDTGTGASWNVGTVADGSRFDGNSYGFATTGPGMWLDTCAARSALDYDLYAESGQVKTFSTSYRTSTTVSGGSITTYTPDAP